MHLLPSVLADSVVSSAAICTSTARAAAITLLVLIGSWLPGAPLVAQSASPEADPLLTPDEYGQFEALGSSALSPFGDWLAYGVRRVDEEEELRIVELASDSVRVVPWGRSPAFSPDGRRVAWTRVVSPEEEERSDGDARAGAGLLDLATGEERSWDDVRTIRFDAEGRFLALHGYPPEEPQGKGADLRIVDLASGTTTSFGNVGAFTWSDEGSLVALVIATGTEQGNGVQLYDAGSGRLRALDTSASTYRHPRWREDAADLVVLRSDTPQGADSVPHSVLAWHGLDGTARDPLVLDARPEGAPDTLAVVGFRAPAWSDDGTRISIGLRPRVQEDEAEEVAGEEDMEPAAEGADPSGRDEDAETPDQGEGADADSAGRGDDEEPELADLQLWHTDDVLIYPQQRSRASGNARRTLLAAWTPEEGEEGGHVVQLGSDLAESAILTDDWSRAVERVSEPYPWGAMFGRPYHDVWIAEVESGERDRVAEEVRYSWTSPGGRFLLTFDGEHYRARDLDTGAESVITEGLEADFANLDYDTPTDVLPPHGLAGWLEDDAAVLLYDRHDVWRVAPDGSGGERLTPGAEDRVTHRIIRPDPTSASGALAPDEPLWFSLRDETTERRGFARAERIDASASVERLLLDDAYPRSLERADSTDVYLYRSESRDVPPELWLAGPELSDRRRVARTNPFLEEIPWTRAELLHFESEAGIPLKGVLLYPADHDPSREYPMIVYTYEQLSQQMHSFQTPSERSYYNFSVWTQEGYFVLFPDIVYRPRDPGVSALEAVRPAVGTVVERGLVDPARVGLVGHSWGGYQATYLPTRTDIFAASVAGAPLTDFKSFMGQIHWNGGNPELTHWETGQARMEVPYWEDVEAHLRNSPAHFVHEMETPLLMAFGEEDGVVEPWQGTLFYNFARRADKDMVLLVYEGEDHGFTSEPNQIDYHRRILEWFGHYLKGEPAPAWITEGVPFESLEEEKRRIRGIGG